MTGNFSTELSAAFCALFGAGLCADVPAVTRAGSRNASSLREYFMPISSLGCRRTPPLKIELRADPDEARRQNGQRLQPGPGPRLHGGVEHRASDVVAPGFRHNLD